MTFSIRLGDIEARLQHLATATGRSKSFYVKESLTRGRSIDDLESIYLQQQAQENAQAQHLDNGPRPEMEPVSRQPELV